MSNAIFRDGIIPGPPLSSPEDEEVVTSAYAMAIVRWLIAIMNDADPDLPRLFRLGAKFHSQGARFTSRQIDAIIKIDDRIIDVAAAGKLDSQCKECAGRRVIDLASINTMGAC